jgi:hypothetical protein
MKIYVASSWRNPAQPSVVAALLSAGHEVYDFRNPAPGNQGFGWRQLGLGDAKEWTPAILRSALQHPVAQSGFSLDMGALRWCDACVLVLPCGRSAHLELGWATGAGKRAIVLTAETLDEPELMYLMCERICLTVDEVISALAEDADSHG